MPNKSNPKKRLRKVRERTLNNKAKRSSMRTYVKRVLKAVESGDREEARKELAEAQKHIDKAAKSRVIHPNNAARKKSLLSRRVDAMGS